MTDLWVVRLEYPGTLAQDAVVSIVHDILREYQPEMPIVYYQERDGIVHHQRAHGADVDAWYECALCNRSYKYCPSCRAHAPVHVDTGLSYDKGPDVCLRCAEMIKAQMAY